MLNLAIPLAYFAFLTGEPTDGALTEESLVERRGLVKTCLMHAGLKRLTPGEDTGMNLDEPFLTALELFNGQLPEH